VLPPCPQRCRPTPSAASAFTHATVPTRPTQHDSKLTNDCVHFGDAVQLLEEQGALLEGEPLGALAGAGANSELDLVDLQLLHDFLVEDGDDGDTSPPEDTPVKPPSAFVQRDASDNVLIGVPDALTRCDAPPVAPVATQPQPAEAPPADTEPDAKPGVKRDAKACRLAPGEAGDGDDADWKPAAASAELAPEGGCRKRRRKNASAEAVRRARRCARSAPRCARFCIDPMPKLLCGDARNLGVGPALTACNLAGTHGSRG
jgi:hypothetical protein